MINTTYHKICLVCFSAVIAFTVFGCKSIQLNSKWRTQNIIIDGKNTEWEGGVFLKDANASINIYNDNDNIYIGIVSSDKTLARKIMMNGFTVWLDRTGSDEKNFGIHFPIGMSDSQPQEMPQMSENQEPPKGMGERGGMEENMMRGFNEFEIMGAGGKPESRIQFVENKGIEVRIGMDKDKFLYELKVPIKIKGDIAYAIGSDTGKVISVGIETGAMSAKSMKKGKPGGGGEEGGQEGSDNGGGGMGGNGGGMGGGGGMAGNGGGRGMGGGRPGGADSEKAQAQLSIWAKVHLSSNK
jgi:hypothetical protein